MHYFAAILTAAILATANGQVISSDPCDSTVTTVTNFIANSYFGTWYEIYSTPQFWEGDLSCIKAMYSQDASGMIKVNNSGIEVVDNKKKWRINIGNASLVSSGKLLVQFPGINDSPASDYWILDTNYVSFSVVYSCRYNGTHKFISNWILSRSQNIKAEDWTAINAVYAKYPDLTMANLEVTDNTKDGCTSGANIAQTTALLTIITFALAKFL